MTSKWTSNVDEAICKKKLRKNDATVSQMVLFTSVVTRTAKTWGGLSVSYNWDSAGLKIFFYRKIWTNGVTDLGA